jgi:hypothetical protein
MKSPRAAGRLSLLVAVLALTAGCSERTDGVPYTVVATDGPPLFSNVDAATTMSALPPPGDGRCDDRVGGQERRVTIAYATVERRHLLRVEHGTRV